MYEYPPPLPLPLPLPLLLPEVLDLPGILDYDVGLVGLVHWLVAGVFVIGKEVASDMDGQGKRWQVGLCVSLSVAGGS